MEEIGEDNFKKSKYNSGVNKILRMDELWKKNNLFRISGRFQKWNENLDIIWCELSADLFDKKKNQNDEKKDLTYEEKQKQFNDLDSNVFKIGNINDELSHGFKVPNSEQIRKRNEHYKAIMKKEIFLRRLENDLGKGTKFDDEEEDEY